MNDSGLVDEFGNPIDLDSFYESYSVQDSEPRSVGPPATRSMIPGGGNAVNRKTGMGGPNDLDIGTTLTPKDLNQEDAETMYQMSWAAQRIVNIIIDDMFAAGRRWTSRDEGLNRLMEEAEDDLKLWERMPNAIRAARIYGSALMVVCPVDGDFESPMDPYEYVEGYIANLIAVDKHSLTIKEWEVEPSNPGYGMPAVYRWAKRIHGKSEGAPGKKYQHYMQPGDKMYESLYPEDVKRGMTAGIIDIHASRVFRFDGHPPPTTEGWRTLGWDPSWGVSVLIPAEHDIKRDISIVNGVGHLVGQASVIVHKIQDFRTYMAAKGMQRKPPPGLPTPDAYGKERSRTISTYNTMYMDINDDIHRMEANFNGLQNIMQQQTHRIAAIAGIPISRFLGIPATGMNATGDGEARDWRITVEAYRKRMIDPILTRRLDIMIARHAGLDEPPEWEWNNLGEMTDTEKSQLAANDTATIAGAYKGGLIDEDEAREKMSRMDFWPELLPWGGPSVHDDFQMQQLQLESQAIQNQRQKMEAAVMGMQLQQHMMGGGPGGMEQAGDPIEGEKGSEAPAIGNDKSGKKPPPGKGGPPGKGAPPKKGKP